MGAYIARHEAFTTNNDTVFGEWQSVSGGEPVYVVYSYGYHFPMYVYAEDQWFQSDAHYSSTTSRHMSYAYPGKTTVVTMEQLQYMIRRGYTVMVSELLRGHI